MTLINDKIISLTNHLGKKCRKNGFEGPKKLSQNKPIEHLFTSKMEVCDIV